MVDIGYLNGLFVLARSIGFIGERLVGGWAGGCCGWPEWEALVSRLWYGQPTPPAAATAHRLMARRLWPCPPAAGHALDQKRLQQPLFRYPWDEVLYTK